MTDEQPKPEPRISRQLYRVGKRLIGGHFEAAVAKALKRVALEQDTTVQLLLARAINDLLERHGEGRPASETPPLRGGAALNALAEASKASAETASKRPQTPKRGAKSR